jgi:hypothetical protein
MFVLAINLHSLHVLHSSQAQIPLRPVFRAVCFCLLDSPISYVHDPDLIAFSIAP